MTRLRVLCLDIEGGRGGSSRSLLQMIAALDRSAVAPQVICRRGGWIEEAYQTLDVPTTLAPKAPKFTALERDSRNIAALAAFALKDWPRARAFRKRFLEAVDAADLVHFNHISWFLLASWLRRRRPSVPICMHLRTNPRETWVARWQARIAAAACDGFVAITENEAAHFERMVAGRRPGPIRVIFNPIEPLTSGIDVWPGLPAGDGLRIAVLANYSHARGLDRLPDIADALRETGASDATFIVAGDMRDGPVQEEVARRGLADRFLFLGHVAQPERVLAGCHVLLKPTREANPWGRDILEALAAGLPVASVGVYDRFVETGRTGLLQERFDARALADWLADLAGDPECRRALGAQASARVAELCNPGRQAAALAECWSELARRRE